MTKIPKKEWERLRLITRSVELKRGESFISQGEVSLDLGVIQKGLLRKFFTDEKGKTYIKGFLKEGDVAINCETILQKTPSYTTVDALEPTTMLVFSMLDFEKFYSFHQCWNIVGRKLYEFFLIQSIQREYQLMSFSAEERYLNFCKENPDLLLRLKKKMIAEYLNISPSFLSRMIGKNK